MQMYAIGSLIIWVSQLQANTVDASRVRRPPLPQLSLLTITNAILCVSWSCFPVTQISTNRLSHAHGGWCTIQHIIPLPRHLVRLRWFMVLLTHIANGSEAATSSQSRRCGPPSGLPISESRKYFGRETWRFACRTTAPAQVSNSLGDSYD